ncbi:MAG: GspH/FimT family protein [Arenimonas sp.]
MKGERGFTLIELIVVLVLVAAVVAIGASAMSRQLPGQRLRESARELAAQLRYTRAQAIASGESKLFTLDARSREWQAGGKRHGRLARDIAILATGARNEQQREGLVAVRFFPEGAATGGRFVLSHGDAAWQVDVQWLTGEVTLQRAKAP